MDERHKKMLLLLKQRVHNVDDLIKQVAEANVMKAQIKSNEFKIEEKSKEKSATTETSTQTEIEMKSAFCQTEKEAEPKTAMAKKNFIPFFNAKNLLKTKKPPPPPPKLVKFFKEGPLHNDNNSTVPRGSFQLPGFRDGLSLRYEILKFIRFYLDGV